MSDVNPTDTDGFEPVGFASPDAPKPEALFENTQPRRSAPRPAAAAE